MRWKTFSFGEQISFFDVIESLQPKEEKVKMLEEALLRGTGFAEGKKRIVNIFGKYSLQKDRLPEIKKEFGIGGFGMCVTKGLCSGFCDGSGYSVEWKCESGDRKCAKFKWNEVDSVLHSLIKSGKYGGY